MLKVPSCFKLSFHLLRGAVGGAACSAAAPAQQWRQTAGPCQHAQAGVLRPNGSILVLFQLLIIPAKQARECACVGGGVGGVQRWQATCAAVPQARRCRSRPCTHQKVQGVCRACSPSGTAAVVTRPVEAAGAGAGAAALSSPLTACCVVWLAPGSAGVEAIVAVRGVVAAGGAVFTVEHRAGVRTGLCIGRGVGGFCPARPHTCSVISCGRLCVGLR